MLKLKLASLDGLTEDIKKEYKKVGDEYVLDVTGGEDVGALQRALQYERDQNTDRQKRLDALTAEVTTLKASHVPGDIEKALQKKLVDQEKELKAEAEKRTKQLHRVLIDDLANQLAKEVSSAPALLVPHIRQRLAVEEVSGELVTRVLKDGAVSALSVNDFKAEVVADPQFAAIIIGSKASGSGAQGKQGGGGGGATKTFKEMTEAEKVALFKSNPDEFKRLKAEG